MTDSVDQVHEPTLQVPVTLFLMLARVYKRQPSQEYLRMEGMYLQVDLLERRATRKLSEFRKKEQEK